MSRAARRALIALVVVVALLVAADRISLGVAENVAANSIKTSQHLDSKPSVSVDGFPFLTQLASGHYGEIHVKAKDVLVGTDSNRLTVTSVAVDLHDVHVNNGFDVVRASTATAVATVSYQDLSTALGTTVSYAGNGRVAASAGTTVLGVQVRGTVSALPVLSNGNRLSFQDIKASALGQQLPDQLNSLLNDIFSPTYALAALPFGLRFEALQATKAGVVTTLQGNNVVYDSRHS